MIVLFCQYSPCPPLVSRGGTCGQIHCLKLPKPRTKRPSPWVKPALSVVEGGRTEGDAEEIEVVG